MIQIGRSFFKLSTSIRSLQVSRTLRDSSRCGFNLSSRTFQTHPPMRNEEMIERGLLRLDSEIRKTGRINRSEVEEILGDIREMKKATSSQSLMIIRCCGDMIPEETPENRTKLAQEIWKTMETLNVPIDISHFNALLRVYLENEYKFSPTEFLAQLEAKGLEPNRVTFQRLIERYCQAGDIDGASTILQHMKEKQLPINENVFNSLILGHAQASDMESAEGIIGVMKQTGLEPNDDTYVALLCGYAKLGDMKNVHRIIKECSENDFHLVDRDFLNLIFALVSSNNAQYIDEIVPYIKKFAGFNFDASNLILKLVNIGQEDVAYKILLMMPRTIRQDEEVPSGFFFIRQMIKGPTSTEKLIQFCEQMEQSGLNKLALSKACETALFFKKFEKAFDLLEAFKEKGYPIRQHYIWPFFASAKNEKDIHDGIKMMHYLGIIPTLETMRDYIVPSIFAVNRAEKKELYERTLDKFSNYSKIPLSQIVPAAILHLLQQGHLDIAAKFGLKYRVRFGSPVLRRPLVEALIRTKDINNFVKAIATSALDGEENVRENVGAILHEFVEFRRRDENLPFLNLVLKELHANGLGLSNSGAEILVNAIGDSMTSELSNAIAALTSSELSPRMTGQIPQRTMIANDDMPAEDLQILLDKARNEGKPINGIRRSLLIAYAKEKNFEKVTELRQEMQRDNFIFTLGTKAVLLDFFSSTGKLDEARDVYNEMRKEDLGAEMIVDDNKILRYAFLLLSNGLYDECVQVLNNQKVSEDRKVGLFGSQNMAWKILNHLAEAGEVEKTKDIYNILVARKFSNPTNVIMGPLIKSYLRRDDVAGALTEFERCVEESNSAPLKNELFCHFIKNDDADRLQRVLDLSTKTHGEVNSLYDLVFAFIDCGKFRQAKKIIDTPGLRARSEKLEYYCNRYVETGKIAELENLIKITKDLFDVDRNSLYFYLLKAYCRIGEVEKAKGIWTSLQEEDVQASNELLTYLADFLKQNNVEVPFVNPERSELPETSNKEETTTKKNEFRRLIERNDIDRALQMKQRMSANSSSLSFEDISQLIDKMLNADRIGEATKLTEELLEKGNYPNPRVLRSLISRLSGSGDYDAIIRIVKQIPEDVNMRINTDSKAKLVNAYVNAGKGKMYFSDILKKEIENGSVSITQGISSSVNLLLKHEELLPEFEELANYAESKGIKDLQNSLWVYHICKKNKTKSNELWESKVKGYTLPKFRRALAEARETKDEEISKDLLNQLNTSPFVNNREKGAALMSVVQILCEKDMPEEALNYLQENIEGYDIGKDLPYTPMSLLKGKLATINISFPFNLPELNEGRRRRTEE